ncbi:MAG: histidine phosphatase family protein [Gammaproteobacteria bacterium]|nr:histidine phosphatase family protein [Gammaproteobacteria bacterium]
MTRELLLLRHGKSDWDVDADDFDRPLTDRGKRGAQRMGVWLATHDMVPQQVISSPAERALVTAEKSCKAMGEGSALIVKDKRIYLADVDDLFDVIREIPDQLERVMLVGHNPGMEEFLITLTNGEAAPEEDGKLLPTATLAILQTDEDWSNLKQGSAKLIRLIRPRTLPKKFPWPLMEAQEYRDRPAYYYNQSSVIPYRVRDGKVEILIVRSSKKKHWVVPKGIHEPGLTAQESAAHEAKEEAGVKGTVNAEAIGQYRYDKWGATCVVDVYTLEVSHVIPENEWEESHRTRQWTSAVQAASLVRQDELGPMILALEKQYSK